MNQNLWFKVMGFIDAGAAVIGMYIDTSLMASVVTVAEKLR